MRIDDDFPERKGRSDDAEDFNDMYYSNNGFANKSEMLDFVQNLNQKTCKDIDNQPFMKTIIDAQFDRTSKKMKI